MGFFSLSPASHLFPSEKRGKAAAISFWQKISGVYEAHQNAYSIRAIINKLKPMIGLLTGTLLIRNDPYIILTVGGVGYKVCAAADVLSKFHTGDKLTVFIHTHVREDALELFGFSDEASLQLFELLLSVSGIGPKTAIGVFSLGEKEKIIGAIRSADVDFFTGVPRLGRKNAQKIIIELKNKIGSVVDLDLQSDGERNDVVVALTGFGFSQDEAKLALREIGEKGSTTSEKVRLALKYLGK